MATTTNRRKMFILALGTCLLVLFAILAALNAFNIGIPNPTSTQQFFVFTGLSIVAFLLFVAVLILLVRNVLKLYADQRSRVMGTRLRTRMLWGAVLVSLIPIVFMFLFSYGLMNRATDRWFSQDVRGMREDSNSLGLKLAEYSSANARAEAESIAASLPDAAAEATQATAHGPHPDSQQENVERILRQHQITLQNGFAILYADGHSTATFQMPSHAGVSAEVR